MTGISDCIPDDPRGKPLRETDMSDATVRRPRGMSTNNGCTVCEVAAPSSVLLVLSGTREARSTVHTMPVPERVGHATAYSMVMIGISALYRWAASVV